MTPDTWALLGAGLALAALNVSRFAWLRVDIRGIRSRIGEIRDRAGALRKRMAHLEGLLEGLREALAGRRNDSNR